MKPGGNEGQTLRKNKETLAARIEQAVGAFIGRFEGNNVGKMVVKLNWVFRGWNRQV